jgi:HEPN domain-containing protein
VNRAQLQRLAQVRIDDAQALLTAGRWAAAYYLTGYAVECALKSCVLRHIDTTGMIFVDAGYLSDLKGCWTHDFTKLVKLAGLDSDFGKARGANKVLERFWIVTTGWEETSRYRDASETDARSLFEAVTHATDGVLQWIQTRW